MNKQSTNEIIKEIFAVSSILIKFGCEDILENRELFVEFLNELGLRTSRGEEFTYMGFRQMMSRLDGNLKARFIEEFNTGFKDVDCHMAMHA